MPLWGLNFSLGRSAASSQLHPEESRIKSVEENVKMASIGITPGQLTKGHAFATIRRRLSNGALRQPPGMTSGRPRHSSISSQRQYSTGPGQQPKFGRRLRDALRRTKIQWYQIPVGLGIGFLGLVQFYKVSSREKEKQEGQAKPKPRARVTPEGPW